MQVRPRKLGRHVSAGASASGDSQAREEMRAFLQKRVAALGRMLASVLGASSVTQDNVISGTRMYMAPEAIVAPDRIDARTDLCALGAVGYFLLTGKEVFSGQDVVEICGHHLHSTPPPSERVAARIPKDLEQLSLDCCRSLQSST